VGVYVQFRWRKGPTDYKTHLEKLMPVMRGVHAQNHRGDYKARTLLSKGDVDYAAVISRMQEVGKEVPIMVEFPATADSQEIFSALAEDCHYLHGLVAAGVG
jgi:sugar phosphate isomerase/epimerase